MLTPCPKLELCSVERPVCSPSDLRAGTGTEIAGLATMLAVTAGAVQAAADCGQIHFIDLPDLVIGGASATWMKVAAWVVTTAGGPPIARRLDGMPWQHTGSMAWNRAGDEIMPGSEACDHA